MTQPLRILLVPLACLGACTPLSAPLDGGKPDPADDGGAPPDGSLPACPAVAMAGLHVVVTNAASGARLCDASVTATQGSYSEVLTPVGTDVETCAFQGVFFTGGVFEVRATRPGFEPAEATATVEADGCGPVRTEEVTLPLIPLEPPGPGPDGGEPLDGGAPRDGGSPPDAALDAGAGDASTFDAGADDGGAAPLDGGQDAGDGAAPLLDGGDASVG